MNQATNNPTPKRTLLNYLNFAVHKEIDCELAQYVLFKGMMLHLVGLPNMQMGVSAYYAGEHRVVGLIPKGMLHHLDDVVQNPYDYCIQLESLDCDQLKGSMWISIEPLPAQTFISELIS